MTLKLKTLNEINQEIYIRDELKYEIQKWIDALNDNHETWSKAWNKPYYLPYQELAEFEHNEDLCISLLVKIFDIKKLNGDDEDE